MRLLFLTPQLPYPPRQGTALRNWGLISHLAQRHEVWLLSFDETTTDASAQPPLRALAGLQTVPLPKRTKTDRLRNLLTSSLPDMAWRLWSPEFQARLDALLAAHAFDIVQVEGIELARYMRRERAPGRPKWVFDDHNCEYLMQQRWFERDRGNPRRWHAAAYSFAQWKRLTAFESWAVGRADHTVCVSPEDAASLAALEPARRAQVVSNGIEMADYAGLPAPAESLPPTVVFTGKMDFRPNIDAMLWFGQQAWPAVRAAHPDAHFRIVGQKPSPRLGALKADPSIEITGAVPDMRDYIAQAHVYVAPLRVGGGTRFKLLEAMAARKAIVSTTLGCEGFSVTSGRQMHIADTPAEFAARVGELLGDAQARQAMGERAFDFVRATYDWSAIVPPLEDAYRALL